MPRGQPGVPTVLRETRLLSEYLTSHFKGQRVIMQPRLGQPGPQNNGRDMTSAELKFIGVWRRYPDAIVLQKDRAIIIEASLKPDPGKISMVLLYARLFPQTVEFEEFARLPVTCLLVWGIPDGATEALARESGVAVDVFQPQWVTDWLTTLRVRDRRPPQVAIA